MFSLPVVTWIGNAAAVLSGQWGAVSQRAREVECSREAMYRVLPISVLDLSYLIRYIRRLNLNLYDVFAFRWSPLCFDAANCLTALRK